MKKILLLIIILLFFNNLKTIVTCKDNNTEITFKKKTVSIIKNKISNNSDYQNNQFITKQNNIIFNSNLLGNNKTIILPTIRGPCSIFKLNTIIYFIYQTTNYEKKIW